MLSGLGMFTVKCVAKLKQLNIFFSNAIWLISAGGLFTILFAGTLHQQRFNIF
jgi:hypothetical protein